MNVIVFECYECGYENAVAEDDFEGQEECENCGAMNEVEIDDFDEDEEEF